MIENLTPAQQVLSVFYAIFFGIMLSTVGARRTNPRREIGFPLLKGEKKDELELNVTLNLFDTPNAWAIGPSRKNKPLWRFFTSLFMLNILPGICFAWFFNELGQVRTDLDYLQILVLVWISLIPNNIYRIYIGFLIKWTNVFYLDPINQKSDDEYKEFSRGDLNAISILHNERKQYKKGQSKLANHLTIPIFWFLPTTVLFYYLIFNQLFNHDWIHYGLLILSASLIYISLGFLWWKAK